MASKLKIIHKICQNQALLLQFEQFTFGNDSYAFWAQHIFAEDSLFYHAASIQLVRK